MNKRKALRCIIFFLCIGVLIFSSRNLIGFFLDSRNHQNVMNEIRELVLIEAKVEDGEPLIDWSALQELNSDVVGWVQFGDYVDFPILQSSDNQFYLNRDFNREWNSLGSIFLDYRNNGLFTDSNNILYGHSTPRGNTDAFGSLELALVVDFFDNQANHYITTITPKNIETWQIFTVYTIHSEDSRYLTTSFSSNDEFSQWLELMTTRNIHQFDITPDVNSQIITFSTCHGSAGTPYRTVIQALLVEEIIMD